MWRESLVGLGAMLLAGCGGGGGSDDPPPTYNELQTQLAQTEMAAVTPFATTLLPDTGTGIYEGVISPNSEGSSFNFQGQMVMEINFAGNTVTGRAENFRLPGDELLQGTLKLNPQALPQNNAAVITGSFAAGTLTGQSVTYDITSLSYNAEFFEPSGDVIAGETTGFVDVTNASGVGNMTDVLIEGTMGLERQN